ncbi:hypothetical protein V8C42DRAFT_356058 [Trichoderma barbatum]
MREDWKTPYSEGKFKIASRSALTACRIFHFAGYGKSDPTEPSQSCLLLDDWATNTLNVGDLRDRRFRHVVGTLWEESDKYCVNVARVPYETMRDEGLTDVAVCRGLHQAVRVLRGGQFKNGHKARKVFCLDSGTLEKGLMNSYWIPYVHFGV